MQHRAEAVLPEERENASKNWKTCIRWKVGICTSRCAAYPLPPTPPSRSLSFTVQFAQMRPACLNKCERDDGGTSLSRYSRVHLGMARARFHVGPRALEERGFPLLDGFSCKLRCFSQRGIAHVQLSVSNSRIDLSRMRGFTRTRQREIRATCCARLE